MDFDLIIILCLAAPFFGGIIYLSLKERNRPEHPVDVMPILLQESARQADSQKKQKRHAR